MNSFSVSSWWSVQRHFNKSVLFFGTVSNIWWFAPQNSNELWKPLKVIVTIYYTHWLTFRSLYLCSVEKETKTRRTGNRKARETVWRSGRGVNQWGTDSASTFISAFGNKKIASATLPLRIIPFYIDACVFVLWRCKFVEDVFCILIHTCNLWAECSHWPTEQIQHKHNL